MVDKRSRGVKRGEDDQRVGRHFMDFLHRAGERTIAGPRRNDLGEAEQRQRIAARELQDDPGDRNGDQQRIKDVVNEPSGTVEPFAEDRFLGRRRRIGEPPEQPQHQDTDHRKPGGNVHEQARRARRTFRKNVVELTKEPSKDHQGYSEPVHHLRNRTVPLSRIT